MVTSLSAFDVCQTYIDDHTNVLRDEDYQSYAGAIRNKDWQFLCRKSAELEGFNRNLQENRLHRQVGAFFKKNSSFRDPLVCETAARDAFMRGEKLCRIANRRLSHYYAQDDRLDPHLASMIKRAERYISSVLGDFSSFQEEIPFLLKLTAGATARTSRSASIPFLRFTRKIDVGPRAKPYVEAAYRYFGYAKPRLKVTPWNRLATVPKNGRTDRMIACEPSGNIPFQLAFDAYCKRQLRFRGIDLSDQSRNQNLAQQGSIHGTYCTVDLSMASDTMSRECVAWLLPTAWFTYLNDLRSTHYSLDLKNCGEELYGEYAKFSSMGNGATFALETLIFCSFAYATGSRSFSVYGDDIIIEPEHVDDLYRLLRFFGFIPNVEKSFTSGPFRESCGGDFFEGIDITPFYIRSEEDWDLPNLSHNINGLAALSEYGELWTYLARIVSERHLSLVPWNENSTSGVFVTPHHAYQQRLFRTTRKGGPWRMYTKAYTQTSGLIECFDSRALALWFLRKQIPEAKALDEGYSTRHVSSHESAPYTGTVTTRHTTSTRRFRRKWQEWHMPLMGNPNHLYGFSELVTSLRTESGG